MARSFKELRKKLPPERQREAEARTKLLIRRAFLYELRQALKVSQEQLAEVMHVKQSSVSKIERKNDVYISTLRKYLEALGGRLIIKAEFPNAEVEITQFESIDEEIANVERKLQLV